MTKITRNQNDARIESGNPKKFAYVLPRTFPQSNGVPVIVQLLLKPFSTKNAMNNASRKPIDASMTIINLDLSTINVLM